MYEIKKLRIPLKEKLAKRKELIKIEARKYFTELDDPDSIELISDKWIVK